MCHEFNMSILMMFSYVCREVCLPLEYVFVLLHREEWKMNGMFVLERETKCA